MNTSDTRIFEPEGRAIEYADEGGNGPAVVLIPGRGLNISYLGLLAHALAEEEFRVVRVGPRHPAAGAERTPTLHDLARDVIDVMDHVGLEAAWIGGHAFGGVLARTVVLDHPARAGGVLLLGVEGAAQTDELADAETEIPDGARDADVVAMQEAAQASSPEIAWSTLPASHPVLVVQGSDDPLTPPANGEALRASAPMLVSVVSVDGAGHLFPLTHVGETAWPIEDYLDWD